jgi:hypothetical protein
MAARGKKDDGSEREEPERDEPEPEAAPPEKRPRRAIVEPTEPAEERGPLTALIEGLDEIVPGLSVLDRELVFEGGARADLAAVDPSGRLYLVLLAHEDADKAALETLDAVAVVRTQLELLLRHFGQEHLNPERAPRVLVVSASSDARLAARLAALGDVGVQVFGLRAVKSAAGERAYLVRLDPAAQSTSGASGVAAFLRALPARLETLGRALVERMERLDEELTPAGDASTLVWRLSGEVLCRVERIGDLLQASVAPRHEPLPLGDLADLEKLVEKSLARLVRVLGLTRSERPANGARGGPPPASDEPLLTPEEIQAFRE